MSGLALRNDACRTKSGLENICLGEGLKPLGPPSQQQAPTGDGCRELSPSWHRMTQEETEMEKKKNPKNSETAPDAE